MADLENWLALFRDKLDQKTHQLIYETLAANQFTSRLQLKLLTAEQIDMMFAKDLALGAKTLLMYQLELLKDESPLPVRKDRRVRAMPSKEGENQSTAAPESRRCVLPALQEQGNKIKEQLEAERRQYREIEMNIESMEIQVQEPPAVGSSKQVCSHCHHRGHRNQISKPCELKKCCEYTFCGIKDKHPEYFHKLNTLKHDLKKKKNEIQELENQSKSMEDFSSNNEFHFIKNLTPRLFAADASYKTNKPKLMRDIRLLRSSFDGRIPPVQTNDPEQLKILLANCKKNLQKFPDAPNFFEGETSADGEYNSPVKCNFVTKHEMKKSSREKDASQFTAKSTGFSASSSSESDDHRHRKRKRKNKKVKKAKRRRRHHSSSSSSHSESGRCSRGSNSYQQPDLPPNYYAQYHIPFNTGITGNVHNVALNTAHMHSMKFQNNQTPNFTNMYYPPISQIPMPFQVSNCSFHPQEGHSVASPKAPDAEELHVNCSTRPESERTQDPNQWGSFNALVNIATQFADSSPKK